MKDQEKPKRCSTSLPNPKQLQTHGQVFQRLNFLHQAAHYLATVTSSTAADKNRMGKRCGTLSNQGDQADTIPKKFDESRSSNPPERKPSKLKHKICRKESKKHNKSHFPSHDSPMLGLSQILSKSMKVIAKKAVTRMDPLAKHSICKSCHLLLLPGHTSSTRLISSKSHRHKVKVTCLACRHQRTIPHPPQPTVSQDPSSDLAFLGKSPKKQQPFWKQPQHATFAGKEIVEGTV